jgi:hypothetical protein
MNDENFRRFRSVVFNYLETRGTCEKMLYVPVKRPFGILFVPINI